MPVMLPLGRVVEWDLSVKDAAAELAPILAAEPDAARRTVRYVERHRADGGLLVYRGLQILNLALGRPAPEASGAEIQAFEEERILASKPLRDAFAELAEMVPELRDIEERTRTDEGRTDDDTAEQRAQLLRRRRDLVGREAADRRPIVRSAIASAIVARYLVATRGRGRYDLDQPILAARPGNTRPM
jgi:hypothetical protein